MVHISGFIPVTVESYFGVGFTAANQDHNPDKTQDCRLQGGCLFVNGDFDELDHFSPTPSGISLRRK